MQASRASSRKRSIVKAITYRLAILCLDFVAIYLFTGKVQTAFGFMIVSNVYTTLGYFFHERIWARVGWGMSPAAEAPVDEHRAVLPRAASEGA